MPPTAKTRRQIPEQGATVATRIKVRATQLGFYNHQRKREGDVFTISADRLTEDIWISDPRTNQQKEILRKKGDLKEFSETWMELVDPNTPERVTGPQASLSKEAADIKAARIPQGDEPTGGVDVLG